MNGGDNRQPSDQQAGWVFKSDGSSQTSGTEATQVLTTSPDESVEWTASEYVAHQKTGGWYVQVVVAAIVVAALVFLITRDVVSTVVILFAGLMFLVAAARKPRVLAYRIDQGGLTIGQKYYPYNQFKSFAVMHEGPLSRVVFVPLKRFIPSVDIFIPPENADAIMTMLSNNLPLETRKAGIVDTFAHRIRF